MSASLTNVESLCSHLTNVSECDASPASIPIFRQVTDAWESCVKQLELALMLALTTKELEGKRRSRQVRSN